MNDQRGHDGLHSPDSVLHRAAEAVVTMGCGDACPIHTGKRSLDWQLNDPADLDLDGIRAVRDEIRQHVEQLLTELAPGVMAAGS